MRAKSIEDVLVHMRTGQWFGFGGKEKTYANLIIHTDDEKPTEEWLNAELTRQQEEWDAEQATAAEAKVSAIEKLQALGLNDAEIASITGG